MSDHIISTGTQDPFIRAMMNLTEAGLEPTPVTEWWACDREAA